MIIQFNTDHNISGGEQMTTPLKALIADSLSRFDAHITRIEAHLSDDDGDKNGANDIRCILEARLEGHQPIAVTAHANTHEQAVSGALAKLHAILGKIKDKQQNHQ